MLKPEHVAEIRFGLKNVKSYQARRMVLLLLSDRAEIRQELEQAYTRRREPGYSLTKALTALIERLK